MIEQVVRSAGPPRLHGRHREIAALEAALRALAVERRGAVVVVTGVRGMGKTTLLDAAARRARGDGTAFLHATATAAAAGFEQELRWNAVRGPVVVAIDDLHEADDITLQGVRTLSERLSDHPILWLLTLAPGRADVTARALTRAGAAVVDLAPLDRDAVRALAADVLGARPSTGVADLVGDLGGHPAAIIELSQALLDEHLIEISDGSARLTGRGLRHVLCDLGVRHPPSDGSASAGALLTRGELAVVELVARGATNRQAAEQLFLSSHTVSSHLRHAFEKLGIRSRVELAILFAEHRTVTRCRPTTALAG